MVESLKREYNTTDPFTMARGMGAIVIEVPLVNVNGFYQRYEDTDIIYINQGLSDDEKILVCAHELGHMVLHYDVNSILLDTDLSVGGKYEIEANAFAVQLLQNDLNLNNEIPIIDWTYNNLAIRRRVCFKIE